MKLDPADVSVVVPCYKSGAVIERAVRSVATQTLLPLEVILVDDASPDDTLIELIRIRDLYPDGWIKVVPSAVNGGPGSARNAGCQYARGKYIAYLDADDVFHPDKISIQYEYMQSHPDISFSGHASGWVRDVSKFDKHNGVCVWTQVSARQQLFTNRFATRSVMIHRSLAGGFKEGMRHAEDYLRWTSLMKAGMNAAVGDLRLSYAVGDPKEHTGLSSSLVAMRKGAIHAYTELHRSGYVSRATLLSLCALAWLKHVLRVAKRVLSS